MILPLNSIHHRKPLVPTLGGVSHTLAVGTEQDPFLTDDVIDMRYAATKYRSMLSLLTQRSGAFDIGRGGHRRPATNGAVPLVGRRDRDDATKSVIIRAAILRSVDAA